MPRLHIETHLVQRIGWLRAAVLGANDGIISTASLVLVTTCLGPKRQQRIARSFSSAAGRAPFGCGRRGVTVEPLRYAAGEGPSLGFSPRQPAVELGDTGP